MAMDTDKVIQRLAESSEPAPPLARPWIRAAVWLAFAMPYVAMVVFVMSPRGDLAQKLSDARFFIEQVGALGTGIAAAIAAFATIVPGYDRKVILLPVVPLAAWLGSLGQGCIQTWMQFGPHGLSLTPDWVCLPAIALVGMVPAIAMAAMLRRGAPLTPHLTTALGGLAAAGLGNFGLRLFHSQDASLMVLVWQFGSVFVLTCLAGSAGHLLLSWRSKIGAVRRRSALG